jgi:hypothetical protein
MRGQVTLCKEIVAIITAFAVERSVRWGDTSGGRGGPLMNADGILDGNRLAGANALQADYCCY